MPIHVPGHRDKRGKSLGKKRSAVAVLQLTAMVDMFTVLAVFLLQNYASTGEILNMPENVELPKATAVKVLKPANVVTVSNTEISLNDEVVVDFMSVNEQNDLVINPLLIKISETIKLEQEKAEAGKSIFKKAISEASNKEDKDEIPPYKKMTIQADKNIDYMTIKKIMFTVTEAGIAQINFAVMENKKDKE